MKITENKTEGLKKDYNIVVPSKDIADKFDAKLAEVGKEVSIAGFRPGKAPLPFLKKKYGDSIMGEVLDRVIGDSVQELFKEKDIRPALQPKIEIVSFKDGEDLEFSVKLEVLPDFPAFDFSTLKVKKVYAEVEDKDIEKALMDLAKNRRDSEKVTEDRAAEKGDITVIDFVGSVDGTEFPGGKGNSFPLELGSGSFIPGFEDQLIGTKAGTETVVKVKFPDTYHAKDLAGKDAEFKVTVKELRTLKEPAVNDDLAKAFGQESIEKLQEIMKAELSKEYDNVSYGHLKRALLDALADAYKFEVPEGMKELEFESIWKQVEQEEKAKGNDTPDEALKAEYQDIANRRVRLGLIISEVGKNEKIQPTSADINRALIAEAGRYPGQEKMLFEFYSKNAQFRDSIQAQVFEDKVVSFILEKVQTEPHKVSIEELYSWYDKEDEKAAAKKEGKAKASAKAKE